MTSMYCPYGLKYKSSGCMWIPCSGNKRYGHCLTKAESEQTHKMVGYIVGAVAAVVVVSIGIAYAFGYVEAPADAVPQSVSQSHRIHA